MKGVGFRLRCELGTHKGSPAGFPDAPRNPCASHRVAPEWDSRNC
jgi:hypothetical protein